MLISAVNALTLSPALCAVFLRHHGQRRGPMGWVLRRIDKVRDGYAGIVRRLVRVSVFGMVVIVGACRGDLSASRCARRPASCRRRTRARFSSRCNCPTAPRSPAPARRSARIEALLKPMPQVAERVRGRRLFDPRRRQRSRIWPSLLPILKPFEDRKRRGQLGASADRARFRRGQQVRTANVIPFNLPPIIGLSTTGGFEYELEGSGRAGPGGDGQRHARAGRRRQSGSAACRACSRPIPRATRRSISISTARRRRRSGSA